MIDWKITHSGANALWLVHLPATSWLRLAIGIKRTEKLLCRFRIHILLSEMGSGPK
jgi:hypothetical protein